MIAAALLQNFGLYHHDRHIRTSSREYHMSLVDVSHHPLPIEQLS